MNTSTTLVRILSIGLPAIASLCIAVGTMSAADYYLQRNQTQGWHWHSVNAGTGWFPKPSGHAPLAEMDPSGIYHTNGFQARTREVNGVGEIDLFAGTTLVIDGAAAGSSGGLAGSLAIKAAGSAIAKANHLVSVSGIFIAGTGSRPQNFHIGTFEQSGSTIFSAASSGRGYNLTIEKLIGDGTIAFAEREISDKSTVVNLRLLDASAYAGTFEVSIGTLTLEQNLSAPAASLILKPGTSLNLNGKTITISALTVGDAVKEPGSYNADNLRDHEITITGMGSIIVAPPER